MLLIAGLGAFGWWAWPIYQFYAHKGRVPLPPTGWVRMPPDAPTSGQAVDPAYGAAGAAALAALSKWRTDTGAPAFSAAVAVNRRLVWAAAVGWADIEARRPATPATQFRIGSTSKALTATALARLVDRGTIDLDTPVSTYLGPLPNPAWATITARQLASHSAGVPHYKENTEFWGLIASITLDQHFVRMADAMTLFDESALLFEPGTRFHYSSLGTVVLGAVIAAAADRPYLNVMKEEVFGPAGMNHTIVAPPASPPNDRLATFYVRRDDQYRPWRPVDLSHRLPGGGFASTPSDLVRLGVRILDDDYVSAKTRRVFWTPQRLSDGQVNPQNYALGWRWRERELEGIGSVSYANHGGVSRGAQCWLLVAPELQMAIAMSINTVTERFADFAGASEAILRAFRAHLPPESSPTGP